MNVYTHTPTPRGKAKASIGVLLKQGRLRLTETRIICMRCWDGASVSTLIWTHRQCTSHCSPTTVFCVTTKEEQKELIIMQKRRSLTLLVATHWEQGLCFGQAGWVWLVCKASATAVQVEVFPRVYGLLCMDHMLRKNPNKLTDTFWLLPLTQDLTPTKFKFPSELSKSPPKPGWQSDIIRPAFTGGVSASLSYFSQLVETHTWEDSTSAGSAVWPYLLSSLGSVETLWHLTVVPNSR